MFRDFDQSTIHDTSSVVSASNRRDKEYYKKNKLTGPYREVDPITGDIVEEGEFWNGKQTGLWKVRDQDGDQQHFRYTEERVGARCHDGSFSTATGRGACSWHGGVAEWLTQNKRNQVGGTGKYQPIQTRLQRTKLKIKQELKININKRNQEILVQVADRLMKLTKQHSELLQTQNIKMEEKNNESQKEQEQKHLNKVIDDYKEKLQEVSQITNELQERNERLQEENADLKNKIKQQQEKLAQKSKSQISQELLSMQIKAIKLESEDKLNQKDQLIEKLRQQLQESRNRQHSMQEKLQKLNVSITESKKSQKKFGRKRDNQNEKIKLQLKLFEEQLRLLNKSIQNQDEQSGSYYDDSVSEVSEQQSSISQSKSYSSRRESKVSRKQHSYNEKQKQLSQKVNKKEQISESVSRKSKKQERESITRILNSKLFMGLNNKSDLSYVENRGNKRDGTMFFKKEAHERINKTVIGCENKGKYRFDLKQEDQQEEQKRQAESSKHVQEAGKESDSGASLPSEDESNQLVVGSNNNKAISPGDENEQIFKSLPFKVEEDISDINIKQ